MLVNIDSELLISNGITPNQFMIGVLILNKKFNVLTVLLEESHFPTSELSRDLKKLVKKGFIKNTNPEGEYDFSKITVDPSFIRLVIKDEAFDEFVLNYPEYTVRPDGTKDYLRVDLPGSRKIYNSIVKKDKLLHKHITDCLLFEVALRRKEGKMQYMKRLPKWLATEEWKSYENRLGEMSSISTNAEVDDLGYGTNLE
jgi:hypothetical protein